MTTQNWPAEEPTQSMPVSETMTDTPAGTERAKEEARALGGEAAEAGRRTVDTAKSEIKDTAQDVAAQARNLSHELAHDLKSQAAVQQDRVSQGLRSISEELRSMAANTEGGGTAAQLVHQLAGKAGDVAGWLDGRDPGSLLDEVKAFGRRRPGAFLAIAAGAGLLAGRLARGLTAGEPEGQSGYAVRPPARPVTEPAVLPEGTAAVPPPAVDPLLGTEPTVGYGTPPAVPPLEDPLRQPPSFGAPGYDPSGGR